jgi:ribosome-binding protein aMBF1 (putative translation factor)
MVAGTLNIRGQEFVVVPRREYERLVGARDELPSLPRVSSDGSLDAIAYSRASIAREVIHRRQRLGLSQADLARKAKMRVETLNRVEKCRTAPSTRTMVRIERALKAAEAAA